MKKPIIIIFICLLLFLVLIILSTTIPWIMMSVFGMLEPNPPAPDITYGEFPFKLEYRIDDETFFIEDVIICEYDGVKWNEGRGKHRVWKEVYKSSGEEDLLIFTDGEINIYCNVGSAKYYMDDLEYSINNSHTPTFYYRSDKNSGSARELLGKYNIELISWELSEPIENKFE